MEARIQCSAKACTLRDTVVGEATDLGEIGGVPSIVVAEALLKSMYIYLYMRNRFDEVYTNVLTSPCGTWNCCLILTASTVSTQRSVPMRAHVMCIFLFSAIFNFMALDEELTWKEIEKQGWLMR